uniref:Collagens n=1 Tax=Dolomedes sulfureus TaxID=492288 RepID=A0A0P0D5F4_9ARAC|nr:collagens [Dolomedes sulfureus]
MVVYKDAKKDSLRRAVKLMAYNDLELVADGNPRFGFDTIQDDCQNRDNNWAQTIVKYSTDKPQRLPIVDVGFKDIGQRSQEFGIDLGPVCFS